MVTCVATTLTVRHSAYCSLSWVYMIFTLNGDYFLRRLNEVFFVMLKCCVLFEVRTEFLNIIRTSFGVEG
jgi:hypothetical protein